MKQSVSVNETSTAVGNGVGFEGSTRLYERARQSLAGGTSTSFRMFERPVPLFIDRAEDSRLIDVDGREYVDFVCGFGPVILGHSSPRVSEAVAAAAGETQQIGGQHEAEVQLAELLCDVVPAFERVRFSVSGSEAIHAAVRLARAVTGRHLVVKFAGHYHGWLDGIYTGTAKPGAAVPDSAGQGSNALADVVAADWNEIDSLERLLMRHDGRLAAVIMEPLPCNLGVFYPQSGYLEAVRRLVDEAGALLIFDEVISGFRVGLGGAQERFGVTPDLSVVAKAMGNGFPISAFGGKADLMEEVATNRVVHAGTYNGGGTSVAAALATVTSLKSDAAVYGRMEELGQRLMSGLTECACAHGHQLVARGPGPVFFAWFAAEAPATFAEHLETDGALYAAWAEALLREGVRVIPAGRWYLTASHTDEDIDRALQAADRAFSTLPSSGA